MLKPASAPPVPSVQTPRELDLRRGFRLLGRALRKQCPNCGQKGLFTRWLELTPICPGCQLRTDRGESDYFMGSFVVNFVVAELLICLGGLVGILATWPDVPWEGLKWGLIAFILPAPAVFYPWAKTIWLAIDLMFRPVTHADLAVQIEAAPQEPAI